MHVWLEFSNYILRTYTWLKIPLFLYFSTISDNFYSNQLFAEALDTKDTNAGGSKFRKNRMVGNVARTKPLGKHLFIYTLALFLVLKAELGKAT